jgi:hypothetical protein
MARLLVVSRSMALAMRIADDHEVVEYAGERLEELAPGQDVEVVVLDLGEPLAAMQTLDRLRERGFTTPVLIVSGYQPAWKDLVGLSIDRVVVVPLPITRAALLDGIDRLLRGEPASPAAPPGRAAPVPAGPTGTAGSDEDGDDDGDAAKGRKRPGLSRFLSGTGPRAGPPPAGAAQAEQSPVRNGSPLAPPTGPIAPPEPEQDLFRPVVEPAVPVRSPSARPRTPVSSPPLASAPTRPATAQSRPAPAPAPARSPAPSRTPVPSTPPAASATPSAPPAQLPTRPAPAPDAGERPAPRPLSLRERPTSPAPSTSSPPPAPAPARAPAPAAPPARAEPASPIPPAPTRALAPGRGPFGPFRGRGHDRGGERHPGFTPAAGVRSAPMSEQRDEVQIAVRALLARRGELFGVTETAQVLADEVVERGESDAAAVLVPDGVRWRVSGGVGLRPLERRLLLDTTHWLISEIAVGGRALLVEDSDIVRPRLAGAPLAAWRHLLAVPVPGIRAAVVLARGQEASRFTEHDLAVVVPVVAEAGPLLSAALEMRELARTLAPLRDVDN